MQIKLKKTAKEGVKLSEMDWGYLIFDIVIVLFFIGIALATQD